MNMLWIWIQDSEEGETRHDHEEIKMDNLLETGVDRPVLFRPVNFVSHTG